MKLPLKGGKLLMPLSTVQPSRPVNAWLRSMDNHYLTLIMEDPSQGKLCGKHPEVGCFDAYFLEVAIDLLRGFTKESSLPTTHSTPPFFSHPGSPSWTQAGAGVPRHKSVTNCPSVLHRDPITLRLLPCYVILNKHIF